MVIISNLKKSFSGNLVIDDLSLTLKDGVVTALVGKNGAGKSTLIRILSGALKPDSGKIEIDNSERIGVLLGGDVSLYSNLTAREIIYYFAQLHDMENNEIKNRINDINHVLKFENFLDKKAKTFSRGMKQKIALTISIIHNPSILLLDEPSTGLDIEASNDVITFIKFLKAQNKTILISTHNIFEISDLSDSIAVLKDGKIKQTIETESFFKNIESKDKSRILINLLEG